MNSSPTIRIKNLITALPSKDIPLGKKFLDKRDFDSLQELINSAIIKVKKYREKNSIDTKYIDVDLEDLRQLKSEVDSYAIFTELPEEDSGEFDDLEDNEIKEMMY